MTTTTETAAIETMDSKPIKGPKPLTAEQLAILATFDGMAAEAKTVALRDKGFTFRAIELAMGWPDDHGCRARRTVFEAKSIWAPGIA